MNPRLRVITPPPHEPVSPLGVAITTPAGKSHHWSAIPVSEIVVFGFADRKARRRSPPNAMLFGVKNSEIVGGAAH